MKPTIAVLNLTRMGDILMTGPMLRLLREYHPGAAIELIVVEGFEEVAELLDVDRVRSLDLLALARIVLDKKGSIAERSESLGNALKSLRTTRYEAIYNLTHTQLSAFLARWMQGPVVAGLHFDDEGYRRIEGAWSRYFFAGNLNRGMNPVHLADLNLGIVHGLNGTGRNALFHIDLPAEAREKAGRLLENESVGSEESPLIALQCGASSEEKRWPAEAFGKVGRLLETKVAARIVLLGTAAEKSLAGVAAQIIGASAIDLTGKTDLPTLAGVLERADLLITNETGTMHLAQAVGTRSLVISLGSALSDETGPYGTGNLILEPEIGCFPCSFHVSCPHHNCHSRISPDSVAQWAEAMLAGHDLQSVANATPKGARGWVTGFDEYGWWRKEPLGQRAATLEGVLREIYREWIRATLEPNLESALGSVERIAERLVECSGAPDAGLLESLATEAAGRVEAVRQEVEVCRELASTLVELVEQGAKEPQKLAEIVSELDDRALRMTREAVSEPMLRPLILFFHFERENQSSGGLAEQVMGTLAHYQRMLESIELLLSLLSTLPGSWEHAAASLATSKAEHATPRDIERKSQPSGSEARTTSDNGNRNTSHSASPHGCLIRPRMRGDQLTVILPVSGYYLQEEIATSLRALGHRVIPLPFEGRDDVIERLLYASVQADLLITVNHLGFDKAGELAALLRKIDLPYVSWYVDRPGFILLDHAIEPWEQAHLFTWEKATLAELREYGFSRVDYLPLATDIERFHPNGSSEGNGRLLWVANSMVRPSAEWREKADVDRYPASLFDRAVALQRTGRIEPREALQTAARAEGIELGSWTKGEKLHFASAVALTAIRELRRDLANALQSQGLELYGDEGWQDLAPDLPLHGEVDYYTRLPAIYRDSLQINATSFQMPTAVNQRVFDVPAAGGVLITDDQEAMGELFNPEKECLLYSDVDECVDIVDRVRTGDGNRDARARMARARERIQNEHTYNHRLRVLLDTVRKGRHEALPVAEGGSR